MGGAKAVLIDEARVTLAALAPIRERGRPWRFLLAAGSTFAIGVGDARTGQSGLCSTAERRAGAATASTICSASTLQSRYMFRQAGPPDANAIRGLAVDDDPTGVIAPRVDLDSSVDCQILGFPACPEQRDFLSGGELWEGSHWREGGLSSSYASR